VSTVSPGSAARGFERSATRDSDMTRRYMAEPGNTDSFREEGIKIHSKLDFKNFETADAGVSYRGVYATGNIKNGAPLLHCQCPVLLASG
jgi:hypothetical protein